MLVALVLAVSMVPLLAAQLFSTTRQPLLLQQLLPTPADAEATALVADAATSVGRRCAPSWKCRLRTGLPNDRPVPSSSPTRAKRWRVAYDYILCVALLRRWSGAAGLSDTAAAAATVAVAAAAATAAAAAAAAAALAFVVQRRGVSIPVVGAEQRGCGWCEAQSRVRDGPNCITLLRLSCVGRRRRVKSIAASKEYNNAVTQSHQLLLC